MPHTEIIKSAMARSGPATGTFIGIQALGYDGGAGQGVVAAVRQAIRSCASGYVSSGYASPPRDIAFRSVEELPAPSGADEAVAFRMFGSGTNEGAGLAITVVRRRATVLVMQSKGFQTNVDRVPDQLIEGQLAKLARSGL
jgi:hypothetical protein